VIFFSPEKFNQNERIFVIASPIRQPEGPVILRTTFNGVPPTKRKLSPAAADDTVCGNTLPTPALQMNSSTERLPSKVANKSLAAVIDSCKSAVIDSYPTAVMKSCPAAVVTDNSRTVDSYPTSLIDSCPSVAIDSRPTVMIGSCPATVIDSRPATVIDSCHRTSTERQLVRGGNDPGWSSVTLISGEDDEENSERSENSSAATSGRSSPSSPEADPPLVLTKGAKVNKNFTVLYLRITLHSYRSVICFFSFIPTSVADPGCFIPDPGSGSDHCSIPDPDPDPGSGG
jgi:hypothetical protein